MKLSKHVNRESKNGKLFWHKGPPPHVGWWQASNFEYSGAWRWWDGEAWSCAVNYKATRAHVVRNANVRSDATDIKWTDHYPANARVPRYDPRG